MKKKIFLLVLILFFAHLGFRIFQYSGNYLTHYNAKYWKDRYQKSQWVKPTTCIRTDPHINPKTCRWDDNWYAEKGRKEKAPDNTIGDDGLYAYAGWEYIHGYNPTLLNAEVPPLGKYLIGASILTFGNQNIFALLSGLLVLGAFFCLNKMIFKDNLFALLPVFIFSLDPLFYSQIKAPYLDLLYLAFLLLTFLFFLKERFFVAAVFLGCMMATKASISTFLLVSGVMFAYLFYMKHTEQLKKFLLSLGISIAVFTMSYAVFFFQGHSLHDFLGVQKWILAFYADGAKGNPLAALQLIFTGNWHTWWGQTVRVDEWSILWPLCFFGSIYYLYYVFPKRRLYPSILFGIWIIAYFVFLVFVPVWPRYLLVVLPFMYNLSMWVVTKKLSHRI